MRLEGKAAMVTGAGSGIGRATAVTLAREGAAVMCADLDPDGARETVEAIEAAGGRAVARPLDVRDEDAVRDALEATAAEVGALHILVNNAGIGGRDHSWDDLIEVNLNGVYYGLKHGAPLIEACGGGAIVSLSSILGLIGLPAASDDGTGYTASKHGVVGLTRAYALTYAPAASASTASTPASSKPRSPPRSGTTPTASSPRRHATPSAASASRRTSPTRSCSW